MSGFGYNVLGFGANASGGGAVLPSDDQFNLVSFLSHFDGSNDGVNSVFDDGSNSNHTITNNGNVTQGSFGPFARPDGEWSVDFDGSDYLDASDGVTFGTGAFTIEFFVYLNANTQQYFFDARPDGVNTRYPVIYMLSNRTLVYYANSSSRITSSTSEKLSEYTWHHIALCRSGTSTKLFLDGTQVGSTYSDSTNYSDSGRMRIGANKNESNNLDGYMSNVRVVNSALYTSNFTPPTAALTAITDTKLLMCQSNRFVDNSADGLTITPESDPTVTTFVPFLSSAVYDPAVNGASAYLSATTDYLSAANSSEFFMEDDAYTIEFWIFDGPASGQTQYIFDNYKTGLTGGMTMYLTSAGKIHMRFSGNTGGYKDTITSNGAFTTSQWSHIAVVRTYVSSNTTMVIYVNGVAKATETFNGITAQSNTSEALTIGDEYQGYICDFRMVKGTAVYTGNFTPPTAPLTAITNTKLLLNMADGQAIDSTAQNNITLGGNANTSTDQAKFGNTSLHLDGTTDYAEIVNVQGFGTGDFTIEGFYRFASFTSQGDVFDFRTALNSALPLLYLNSSGELIYYLSGAVRIQAGSGNELSTNTWYHIALCRGSGSTKLFVDGTQVGSTYSDSTTYLIAPIVRIGARSYGSTPDQNIDGFVDDFRISRMARYTSNFTAPTAAFPDKGQ